MDVSVRKKQEVQGKSEQLSALLTSASARSSTLVPSGSSPATIFSGLAEMWRPRLSPTQSISLVR